MLLRRIFTLKTNYEMKEIVKGNIIKGNTRCLVSLKRDFMMNIQKVPKSFYLALVELEVSGVLWVT